MSTENDLTGFKTLVNQPSAPPVVSNWRLIEVDC